MKILKRALVALAVLVVVAVGALAAVFVSTFGAVKSLPEAGLLPSGVVLVKDNGYVGVFIVPLSQEGHVLLVDCGNDKEAKAVKAVLDDKKLAVDGILVTHGHPDHVGGCNALKERDHMPVYALTAEVPLVHGDVAPTSPEGKLFGPHHLGVTVERPVNDNDTVEIGGVTAKALALPGHTSGSTAWLVGDVLFLGDAASLGKDGHVIGPPAIFTEDMGKAKRSLGALGLSFLEQQARPAWMIFSHSDEVASDGPGPWEDLKKLGEEGR
jgi:glyoxylase-like metal-dependent hydrolase (beta-lactamase superfamily II)